MPGTNPLVVGKGDDILRQKFILYHFNTDLFPQQMELNHNQLGGTLSMDSGPPKPLSFLHDKSSNFEKLNHDLLMIHDGFD